MVGGSTTPRVRAPGRTRRAGLVRHAAVEGGGDLRQEPAQPVLLAGDLAALPAAGRRLEAGADEELAGRVGSARQGGAQLVRDLEGLAAQRHLPDEAVRQLPR